MTHFSRKPIEGVFALTPLCLKENQEIDYEGIRYNIDWLEKRGVNGFIQFGCRGQMNAPSEEEFNKVCDVCVDTAKGKQIAAIVSSTATNTREVIRRAKYAEERGADGTMLSLPYGFPLIDEWIVEFYRMVHEALKGELAIMVYNTPRLTQTNISPGLWEKHLLNIGSIKAIKEANAAQNHRVEVLLAVADKINWMSSNDPFFWHDSMLGAKGLVGIFTWVAPRTVVQFYKECRRGNHKDPWTLKVYKALVNAFGGLKRGLMTPPLDYAAYEHGNHNALVELGGGKAGPPRKPYGSYSAEARKALEELVRPLMEIENKF